MQHLLAGTQIRLVYLQDRRALRGIDWPSVFDDLTDAGAPMSRWQWCDLDRLTHVVLAIDRITGHYAGVLGLTAEATPPDQRLMLDLALVRPKENGLTLPRAMLAHALARIVCLDGKPLAITASQGNRPVLTDLSQNVRSTALHPPAEGNVIALRAARLGREIGGGRTVLDLSPVSESSLLRDLRGLHGVRPVRAKVSPVEGVMEKLATSAAARRRPRKATHTGRTG